MYWNWRAIAITAGIAIVLVIGAVGAVNWFWPGATERRPTLATLPPLAPVTRASTIITPVAIALTAIREALERVAPPELTGKPELGSVPFLSNADVGYTVSRGPFSVAGRSDGITVSSVLSGTLRLSGQTGSQGGAPSGPSGFPGFPGLPSPPGGLPNPFSNLFGGGPGGSGAQAQGERTSEQGGDIRGNLALTARPTLLPGWRIDPNLTSQISIADASLSIMGMKLNVPEAVKPLLDRAINGLVGTLQEKVRDDPSFEQAARQEWAKACRSLSLGAAGPGMPNLWLELRPTRMFAAQPRIDENALTLTVGVQADTRIVPHETKPDCPFPAQLDIVPQMEQGRVNIAVPIDVPFTEISRLLETQLKGKSFPEDRAGAFTATIRSVKLAASRDRLLLSLGVRANETKTWLGLGAEATIHLWGRPVLDTRRQTLRLDNIAVDVASQAAFGLLGLAGRAAAPYLEQAVAQNAVIDLEPLKANARKSIEAGVADFRRRAEGVRVDAEVVDLRLVGIEFDAQTLRVIAEGDGTVRVAVTKLDIK